MILTLDEDWFGETILVDWLDFVANGLPVEVFIYVELAGASQVPKVWLNARCRTQTESVLLRTGDNSPAGVAGATLRQFIWQHVWEKVVPWTLKKESEEDQLPASRIAKMWRENFAEQG